ATHCTQYKSKIKSLYPEKYIEGGAGRIIEIE
ncbi:MAG TPA: MBL fold metallo-hydrolase, partial [Candidatus Desulfofervidus auxilii]|nr:MBL fold metallo-hydrolase [Candidatus Desulfofervidus auxilii]